MADPVILDAHTLATANRQQTNLIWERTQAAIACGVTLAYIAAQLMGKGLTAEGLANAFFLVIGFYFGRTNHARPGMTNPPAVSVETAA